MGTTHLALVADDETTVDLGADFGRVAVLNVSGTTPVYFRVDGTPAVAAADGTFAVLPAARRVVDVETNGDTSVSLIATAAADVEVEGL